MQSTEITEDKDSLEIDPCDGCPQKKTWDVISITAEEKGKMDKPVVRSWGPFR